MLPIHQLHPLHEMLHSTPLGGQQHHAASAWRYVAGAGICAACNEPRRRKASSQLVLCRRAAVQAS